MRRGRNVSAAIRVSGSASRTIAGSIFWTSPEVFEDADRLDFADERFDDGEDRRIAIGRVVGRIFTLVYTVKADVVWLITAWPSNRRERTRYEAE